MKVCLAALKLQRYGGGHENYRNIINKLEELGNEAILLGPKTASAMYKKIDYCPFFITDKTLPLAIIYFIRKVRKISRDFDVVNCYLPSPSLSFVGDLIKFENKTKIIVNFLSPSIDDLSSIFPYLGKSFLHYFFRICMNNSAIIRLSLFICDRYVVSSNYQKEQLLNAGCSKNKVEVIPNCIDTRIYVNYNKSESKKKFDFNESNVISYIGHLRYDKGVEFLVDAFPEILNMLPDTRLVIAWSGVGSQKGRIAKLIDKRGINSKATILGKVNVPQLLSATDVLILPYVFTFETYSFPSILLEAFSVGVPVIASDIKPLDEVIGNGASGVLVPMRNSTVIARSVVELLKNANMREEMSKKQRIIARERFASDVIAEKYTELYGRVLNG